MQIYLWAERKCRLAGIEELNNIIVKKYLNYIYFQAILGILRVT